MAHKSIIHAGATQTTPAIYAAHPFLGVGWHNESSYEQWTLCGTIAGQCAWNFQGYEVMTKPGDMLITRPHVDIAWRNSPADVPSRTDQSRQASEGDIWECGYAVFHPRPHWIAWLDSFDFQQGVAVMHFEGSAWEAATTELCRMTDTFEHGGMLRDEWSMNALERLLLNLYALSETDENSLDYRIKSAVEYIHASFAEPMTVGDIARAAGLSVSRLSALFVASVGCAPVQYLERVRLERAAEMLQFGGMGIGKIASAVGYTQPYYFARRFRMLYGKSPTQYRQARKSKERWTENPAA